LLLYAVLPPGRPVKKGATVDAAHYRSEATKEFIARLAVAVVFSVLFGDYVVDLMTEHFPGALAAKHPHVWYVVSGAPGWWVTRWVALWLYKHRNKDAGQIADEIKDRVRK